MKASTFTDSPTQTPTLETLAVTWALECLADIRRDYGEDPADWKIDVTSWGESWFEEEGSETHDYALLDLMNRIRSRLGLDPL